MLEKLEGIKARFEELAVALSNPEIVNDNRKYKQLSKEYRSMEKIVNVRNEYAKVIDDIEFNREMINSDDEEMRDLPNRNYLACSKKKNNLKTNQEHADPKRSAG